MTIDKINCTNGKRDQCERHLTPDFLKKIGKKSGDTKFKTRKKYGGKQKNQKLENLKLEKKMWGYQKYLWGGCGIVPKNKKVQLLIC